MTTSRILHTGEKRKGETLLEVLIALVVLIIGSVTATSLILTSIKANLYNKDALQALNLAQEGIEYMRNLRDTNWIRFSANRQGCWNVKPGSASCTIPNLLAEALTTDSGYALGTVLSARLTPQLDLSNGDDAVYLLKYYDLNSLEDSDGIDRKDSGNLLDVQDDYDYVTTSHPSGTFVDNSKFYRSINIDYKTIGPAPTWTIGETADPATADMMMVSSKVQWKDGGTVHQVVLSSALTRYR
jgi:type II secretory pathway pseudopilin PulG